MFVSLWRTCIRSCMPGKQAVCSSAQRALSRTSKSAKATYLGRKRVFFCSASFSVVRTTNDFQLRRVSVGTHRQRAGRAITTHTAVAQSASQLTMGEWIPGCDEPRVECPETCFSDQIPTIGSIHTYPDSYTHVRIIYIMLNKRFGHIVTHRHNCRLMGQVSPSSKGSYKFRIKLQEWMLRMPWDFYRHVS